MAFPKILINSATGSDSLASGAGPGTALTGSAGVSDGTGLVVTLDGSPDLTNVATDGSHALYFADATAGNRNFSAITAKANSGTPTAQVTVNNAFGLSLTKAWAIGGVRASIDSTTSKKLHDNNGASGDAMPGWIMELQSGHAETISSQFEMRRAGNTTDGPITLQGTYGAATLPKLTSSTGALMLVPRSSGWVVQDIEFQATAGGSIIWSGAAGNTKYVRLKVSDQTNHYTNGFLLADGDVLQGCSIAYVTNTGATLSINGGSIVGCEIQHCTMGIDCNSDNLAGTVYNNLVHDNSSHGILIGAGASGTPNRRVSVYQNTCNANGGDGIRNSSTQAQAFASPIYNNILSNNSGYGLNFTGAGVTANFLLSQGIQCYNNNTYNNTSGACNLSGILIDNPALDPQFVNTGGGNYAIGTNLKGLGYPAGTNNGVIGTYGSTNSYLDIGAAQRQEASGGGTAAIFFAVKP